MQTHDTFGNTLFLFLSAVAVNTMTKSNLGEKEAYFSLLSQAQAITAGSQDRSSSRNHEGVMLGGSLTGPCSTRSSCAWGWSSPQWTRPA